MATKDASLDLGSKEEDPDDAASLRLNSVAPIRMRRLFLGNTVALLLCGLPPSLLTLDRSEGDLLGDLIVALAVGVASEYLLFFAEVLRAAGLFDAVGEDVRCLLVGGVFAGLVLGAVSTVVLFGEESLGCPSILPPDFSCVSEFFGERTPRMAANATRVAGL